jgi:hypothetical protein
VSQLPTWLSVLRTTGQIDQGVSFGEIVFSELHKLGCSGRAPLRERINVALPGDPA